MTDLEQDVDTSMPLMSQEFVDALLESGMSPQQVGWLAAEMDAAPEDDGIHAWQTYCNRLAYPEYVPPSVHQVQAGREVQALADAKIQKMIQEANLLDYIPHAAVLPYNVLVDVWMAAEESRRAHISEDKIRERVKKIVTDAFVKDAKKAIKQKKRVTSA